MHFYQDKMFITLSLLILSCYLCDAQEPWDNQEEDPVDYVDDRNIPPDLRMDPRKKTVNFDENNRIGDWFFRRLLSIVLKGGEVKDEGDGTVDIKLNLNLDRKHWNTLNDYLTETALTEEKIRRMLGYIEQSIYQPSIPIKVIVTWNEYAKIFLRNYKYQLMWTFSILAILCLLPWIWRSFHFTRTHLLALTFIVMYTYEVLISYKEAEQKEIEMFVAAVNSCKWYLWSSQCELPKPDPLIFLAHMNPMKIGIRMFTTLISEPIIGVSGAMMTATHTVTDGLWYPFNTIVYGILMTIINIILMIVLISVIFNYILNIPINLSFGLFSVGFHQRNRNLFRSNSFNNQTNIDVRENTPSVQNTNAVNGATIDKLLDVFSKVLDAPQRGNQNQDASRHLGDRNQKQIMNCTRNTWLKRSASTGRLPTKNFFREGYDQGATRRNAGLQLCLGGSGDAR